MAEGVINNRNITIRRITFATSAAANGTYNTNLKTKIDADLPSGCVCLGVCGFTTGQDQLLPVAVNYSDNAYSYMVRNITANPKEGTATVQYLCQRT